MRIIAGKYRGKKLHSPSGDNVRPTADRARESVFNILNSKVGNWNEVKILDVFCGTGAFGLEALSRGATEVCLIDIDTSIARKNAELFKDEKNKIKITQVDIKKLPQAKEKYNLIFMDAPYNKGLSEIAYKNLVEKGWIEEGALMVIETEKSEVLNLMPELDLDDERIYGLAKFLFFYI